MLWILDTAISAPAHDAVAALGRLQHTRDRLRALGLSFRVPPHVLRQPALVLARLQPLPTPRGELHGASLRALRGRRCLGRGGERRG
jgi:hypothetical protein